MQWEIAGMPTSYPIEQKMRPILLALLCFIPFIGAIFYACMSTMSRYISRNFITYFLMCTLIMLLIYILADFTDNMERFRSRFDDPIIQALQFYGTQLPMFLYQILPYTLLMGTLWSLSKLSVSCEITGMMQSGRSLLRLCLPIFLLGSLVALTYGICGFHWAPNGSMYRQMTLKQSRSADGSALPIIYRSEANARIWRVEHPATMQDPGAPMRQVVIEQFDTNTQGKLSQQIRADEAVWNKSNSTWTFNHAAIRHLGSASTKPVDDELHECIVMNFDEKPYQIISPTQSRSNESMGTSTMYEFIASGAGSREDRARVRTEWHVRIARVFSCLILILLALPSAVTFQRRGTMKGIGIAVLLASLLLFFYRVFPALGEARIIQAWISAWIPNVCYLMIAIYLFRKNLAHRSFKEWWQAKLKGKP